MALTSRIANFLKSATTIIDVMSAAAPSSGQVLTATGPSAATWQSPSGGTPTFILSTLFEDTVRFDTNLTSGGTETFGDTGLAISTSATGGSAVRTKINAADTTFYPFLDSPIFGCSLYFETEGTTLSSFFGIGIIAVNGAGHTYTNAHIGFKILTATSVSSLYATQADGSTENASSALTTLNGGDMLDIKLKVNGSTSVDYYWRKNNGTWSSATNLTSNLPQGTGSTIMQFSISNDSTATGTDIRLNGASYQR